MTGPTSGSREAGAAGRLFGVDVGGTKLRTALADADGTVLAERVESTVRDSASGLVQRIADALEALQAEAPARIRDGPVLAAGVALPVGVDPVTGELDSIHNIPGLADADRLRSDLERAVGMRVAMDNDANAAALGERALGVAQGADDFAVIALGTGIGIGIVAGGRLIRGARGMAGEIAFLPPGASPLLESPSPDASALRPPDVLDVPSYEAQVAGPGLRDRIDAAVRSSTPTRLWIGASFGDATVLAAEGDLVAMRLVDDQARALAVGIAALVALLDPELIVLSGGVGSLPGLLEPVRRQVARMVRVAPRIETGLLGERGPLVGALELARLELAV